MLEFLKTLDKEYESNLMNISCKTKKMLSFGMGMWENKCESDRDSLLIVVKVFSLRSARSFTSTCQLLHTLKVQKKANVEKLGHTEKKKNFTPGYRFTYVINNTVLSVFRLVFWPIHSSFLSLGVNKELTSRTCKSFTMTGILGMTFPFFLSFRLLFSKLKKGLTGG